MNGGTGNMHDADEQFLNHPLPRHAEAADGYVLAEVPYEDGPSSWELLYARRVDEGVFEICCIPGFARNVALGDHVATRPGPQWPIAESIVHNSGHYAYRVWLGELSEERVREVASRILSELIGDIGCDYEQITNHLLAIDAEGHRIASNAVAWLDKEEAAGNLTWESAND
jgi:hypothetical protein